MEVKVKFFANFREILGQKDISVSEENIRELVDNIAENYEELNEELFEDQEKRKLNDFVNIMVNGRRIEMLDGFDTELEDGDTVAIFPPVAGG